MEPGEALGIAAQIAVALAGFAGVVVVFRRESVHEWSAVDKLRLRFLLANSLLPLGLCMMGMVLLTINRSRPESGDGAAESHSRFLWLSPFTMTKYFRRLDLRQLQRESVTRFVFYLIGMFGHSSKPLATLQRCFSRRVLAVLHNHCIPNHHRPVPVCAHGPSTA